MNKWTSNEWFNLTMPSPALRYNLSLSEKLVRFVPPICRFTFSVQHYDLTAPLKKCSQAFKIENLSLPAAPLKNKGTAMSVWTPPCKWHHLNEERAVNESGDEEQFCVNS